MKISEFLSPDAVLTELQATDKPAVLGELCAPMAARYPRLSVESLQQLLEEREELGSTGIGDGIAIPHAKLSGLSGLTATFGRSLEGVDFQSLDGKPAYLFFALFAPTDSAGTHLKALARISRLLKSGELRRALLDAGSAEEIYRRMVSEDERY